MDTKYPLNGLVFAKTGFDNTDILFWRVIERVGNKIRLHPLIPAFTLKGNPIPGPLAPHGKAIARKIVRLYNYETIAPVIMGQVVLGLRPWDNRPKIMGRGGKRIGAGRKKGGGKGRSSLSKSITLTADEWARIEVLKGSMGMSEFFKTIIFHEEKRFEKEFDAGQQSP